MRKVFSLCSCLIMERSNLTQTIWISQESVTNHKVQSLHVLTLYPYFSLWQLSLLYISVYISANPCARYKAARRNKIRFVYVFVSIFQIFYPILYAGVRFTQIFSRLIKNYTLSYIHFFLLFMAVSSRSPRTRMVRFRVSRSTLQPPVPLPSFYCAFHC